MDKTILTLQDCDNCLSIVKDTESFGDNLSSKWAALAMTAFCKLSESGLIGKMDNPSHIESFDFKITIECKKSLSSFSDFDEEDEDRYIEFYENCEHGISSDNIDYTLKVPGTAYKLTVDYEGSNLIGGMTKPQARVGLALYHYLHACFAKNDLRRK